MSPHLNRRHFIAGASSATAFALTQPAFARTKATVAVIGGGFGGATAAGELKRLMPNGRIVLIEPNARYTACPFSNLVISGERILPQQMFSYDGLKRAGVEVVNAAATTIDTDAQRIVTSDAEAISYDRLVLSPGIDIRWSAIDGYDKSAAEVFPHAWKAGPQTELLRDQLQAMDDGGLVVISAPAAPYRCPPGPYERASVIASYLKRHKPRSKLIVLDAKDSFSKKPLFLDAWATRYGNLLEWRSGSNDGQVARVDPSGKTVFTDFDTFSPAVANIIPPQKAGQIAIATGVADATGWCPVEALSFESTLQKKVHVIGDAMIAAPMPKSAFSAHLQAKVCAYQIARLLSDQAPVETVLANTCYSFIDANSAISVSGVYRNTDGILSEVAGAGGISPLGVPNYQRAVEAVQAREWFETITQNTFLTG